MSLYFGNSPEFWMNLQTHYDLKRARKNLKPDDAKRFKARRAAYDCTPRAILIIKGARLCGRVGPPANTALRPRDSARKDGGEEEARLRQKLVPFQ